MRGVEFKLDMRHSIRPASLGNTLNGRLRMIQMPGMPARDRRPFPWPSVLILGLNMVSVSGACARQPISLSWPVSCKIGQTCFVQNYVDHDAGNAARDYRCGPQTYHGHEGTDIRLLDMAEEEAGVAVLAAAEGRVARTRDGVDDISIRVTGKAAVAGKECGNGVFIEHADGWTTQYCHLKKGSIVVTPGQVVTAGTPLGQVGLSGETEFPHLHLAVRHDGIIVDPFAADESPEACTGGHSLWTPKISQALDYKEREILNFGFSVITPTMENIESGAVHLTAPDQHAAELVAYVRSIGLRKGDEQMISVKFPDGTSLAEYKVPMLQTNKAQFFAVAGQRRKDKPWPVGVYTTTFRVLNDGNEVLSKTFSLELR